MLKVVLALHSRRFPTRALGGMHAARRPRTAALSLTGVSDIAPLFADLMRTEPKRRFYCAWSASKTVTSAIQNGVRPNRHR